MSDPCRSESPWALFQSHLETVTPVDTTITGTIPEWLSGTLYRNGCGFFHEDTKASTHLFEGYGVLHRYDIGQGTVKYTSRILHRDAWLRSLKAHRTVVAADGSIQDIVDPCMETFSGSATIYSSGSPEGKESGEDAEDKTGVNIVRHGDKLFALTESPILQEIDPATLKLKGKIDVQKLLSVHMATAHPHFGRDGAMYNLGTVFAPPNNYNIIKIPPRALHSEEDLSRHVKLVASVQSRWNFGVSYSHSFGMTDRHFVLLEQPATLSTVRILGKGATGQIHPTQVFRNFDLHPQEKIRFHLISRGQGNTVLATQYYAPPCFTFHFVNCYDDGDYVVVDLCSYDNLNIINDLTVGDVASNTGDMVTATIRRYVLPLSTQHAPLNHNLRTLPYTTARARVTSPGVVHLTPDLICKPQDKMYIELPRINYEMCGGRKYRYVYGTSMLTMQHRLIKLDLESRRPVFWEEEGCDPAEPVFIPRPGATEEDDGVVLSPVVGLKAEVPCFLLLLDARSFMELGRATTPHGVRIAPSFHGNFYSKPQ